MSVNRRSPPSGEASLITPGARGAAGGKHSYSAPAFLERARNAMRFNLRSAEYGWIRIAIRRYDTGRAGTLGYSITCDFALNRISSRDRESLCQRSWRHFGKPARVTGMHVPPEQRLVCRPAIVALQASEPAERGGARHPRPCRLLTKR